LLPLLLNAKPLPLLPAPPMPLMLLAGDELSMLRLRPLAAATAAAADRACAMPRLSSAALLNDARRLTPGATPDLFSCCCWPAKLPLLLVDTPPAAPAAPAAAVLLTAEVAGLSEAFGSAGTGLIQPDAGPMFADPRSLKYPGVMLSGSIGCGG
jgi:hypothetical protein